MTDFPDLTPGPDELDAIIRRGRYRRWRSASGGVAGALALTAALLVVVASGPNGRDESRVAITADDDDGSAEPTPAVSDSASPDPTATPAQPPPPSASSEPSATEASQISGPQGTAAAVATVAVESREPYTDQLEPRYVRAGGAMCQNHVIDPADPVHAVIRDGYCISFGGGSSDPGPDAMDMFIEICRLPDSTSGGRLDFATEKEADFAIYRARQDDDGRLVRGDQVVRFSDGFVYGARPHARSMTQGDCWRWETEVAFARAQRGGFAAVFETPTTSFAPEYREWSYYFEQ